MRTRRLPTLETPTLPSGTPGSPEGLPGVVVPGFDGFTAGNPARNPGQQEVTSHGIR
jgi:hypothetical protein